MKQGAWFSGAVVAVAVAGAVTCGWQWQHNQELRLAIERARSQSRERTRLLAENRRLAAVQPSEAELAQLRADRSALARLRSEVEKAKINTEQIEHAVNTGGAAVTLAPASAWKNAGRASAIAAVETVFWASAQSDMATLATGITFDAATQASVDALWQLLPAAEREHYGSAAGTIAAALLEDGAQIAFMGVVSAEQTTADTATVRARVENSQHQGKTENFEFRHTDDGWRLVIPSRALASYEAALKAHVAAANGLGDGR